MISIVRQSPSDFALPYTYRFAGQVVAFNEPVHSLAAFEFDAGKVLLSSSDFDSLLGIEILNSNNSELCYQGLALFDQRMRAIDYWRVGNLAQIDIDGVPSCRLDLLNQCVVILNDLAFDVPFNLELITGPALILLLAEQSIFCLHAGAVSFPSLEEQVNIAFLADSGVGKSTLSQSFPPVWQQLCDDILPVQMAQSSVEIFNDFPQLKLHQACVENAELKSKHLNAIVCLSAYVSENIVIERMSAVQSVLAIIRHTVASRLFDNDLLVRHCEFAQSFCAAIPVFQVSYPRDYTQLPELRERIMQSVCSWD